MRIIRPLLGLIVALTIFLSCHVNANSLEAESLSSHGNVKLRRQLVTYISKKKVRRNPSFMRAPLQERADPNDSKTVENTSATSSASAVATQAASKKSQAEPISMVTIVALISGGGVVIVAAIIFAIIRKRRFKQKSVNDITCTREQKNDLYQEVKDNELQALSSHTAIGAYTPNLSDELFIQLGDKLTILVEYNDGWVLGANETRGGTKGAFPKRCINMNSALNHNRSSSIN